MNKSSTMTTVEFHGQQLTTLEQDGQAYVALKPICEAIGLQWEAQLKRLKRNPVLLTSMSIMDIQLRDDIQHRKYVTIPIKYLNGWLFGVDVNRVKPEIREGLLMYQRECFEVLANYWQHKHERLQLPLGITEGDIVNSHALDVHIKFIHQHWIESVGPALKMLKSPKFVDLNERIGAAYWLAKSLNLKNRYR